MTFVQIKILKCNLFFCKNGVFYRIYGIVDMFVAVLGRIKLYNVLFENVRTYCIIKYHGEPHTTPPHNDNNPDGTDNSDRGFLITEFLTTNLTSSEYYTYRKRAKREFLIRILL